METSEEMPSSEYVFRVFRALGEREILKRIKGLLIGRPKAWEFSRQTSDEEKAVYKQEQRDTILKAVRAYNSDITIIQNVDFGHTSPQICMPMGKVLTINSSDKSLCCEF